MVLDGIEEAFTYEASYLVAVDHRRLYVGTKVCVTTKR